jgi:DNA-binding transcriptional LysR family regulator
MSEGANQGPWSIEEARTACREATRQQKTAEDNLREAAKDFALAEESYRKALALEIVRQHAEEGAAWTVAPDLARGDSKVAELRRERDIKEGVREAMQQAAWRASANRRDVQRFLDWSARRELAEGYGHVPEPDFENVTPARAA